MGHPFSSSISRRSMLAAGAAGALPLPALAQAEPKRGGTLVFLVDEPPTLVSLLNTGSPQFVSAKVTEGLLAYDFELNPMPQLATAWEVSSDGLRYTFKLRQGVRWHDGRPFTADDVVFSLNLVKARHPRGSSTFANVADIQAPDPGTVVLTLSKPAPYLLTALSATEAPIMPKHRYDPADPAKSPNNNAPIGTGPFVFKEWVRGSHLIYERNPNYWNAPKPYADKILVRFIPDPAARALALETGEVHLAQGDKLALAQLQSLQKMPHIVFENVNGQQYDNSITELMFNMEKPYFKDLRVRQAFAHAINRQTVRDTCWLGYGILGNGPFSPYQKRFHDATVKGYEFDPRKAEALLDAAGYPRKEGGIRLRVTHDYMPGTEGFKRSAEYFKQALAPLGVDVTIRSQDFATYARRVFTARDFDFTYGYISTTFDPTVGVQRLFWSKNFRPGVPFSNGSAYSNPEVDKLFEAAAVEMNHQKRREMFSRLQHIIAHDIPAMQILTRHVLTVAHRKVRQHTVVAEGLRGNFADLHLVEA